MTSLFRYDMGRTAADACNPQPECTVCMVDRMKDPTPPPTSTNLCPSPEPQMCPPQGDPCDGMIEGFHGGYRRHRHRWGRRGFRYGYRYNPWLYYPYHYNTTPIVTKVVKKNETPQQDKTTSVVALIALAIGVMALMNRR